MFFKAEQRFARWRDRRELTAAEEGSRLVSTDIAASTTLLRVCLGASSIKVMLAYLNSLIIFLLFSVISID